MNLVANFLSENWYQLSLERYGRPPFSMLTLTPGFRASRNVILLIFTYGNAEPALVAKVSRLPETGSAIRTEADNLTRIQRSRKGGFDSIPRLLTVGGDKDCAFLVETMLPGSLMSPSSVRRDKARCTESVLACLTELGLATRRSSAGEQGWFERLAIEPADRFRAAMPVSAEEEQWLRRSSEIADELRGRGLPLVFEHGDPSDPNLLRLNNGEAGMVDWELAEANSLPAVDVFFFLTYVAFSQRRAGKPAQYVAAFEQAFFGRSAWAIPYVLIYARSLDLHPETLTPLFVLGWLRYLVKLMTRLSPTGEIPCRNTVDWIRSNRYYLLWKHAVEHASDLGWNS